jgi:hypothetical protein
MILRIAEQQTKLRSKPLGKMNKRNYFRGICPLNSSY